MILRQLRLVMFVGALSLSCFGSTVTAQTPVTPIDADFDTLLQARLVRMPEAARMSADFMQGFAGRYLCREMQEARGNEFRMQAALARAQESIRQTVQRPAAAEVVIRARGSFRNYDFQSGIFPITLEKELLYTFSQNDDRNRGVCLSESREMPVRIGVQVSNNTGFDGLRMDRDQAERFMAARTDRFNNVNRDIVYEFTVRLDGLTTAAPASMFRQEPIPALTGTVVRFRVLDDLRSARPLLEIDRAAMASLNRAVEVAAMRMPVFQRFNWMPPPNDLPIGEFTYDALMPIWHSLSSREAPIEAIVARLPPVVGARAGSASSQIGRAADPTAEAARLTPIVRDLLEEWGQHASKPWRIRMTALLTDQGALSAIDGSTLGVAAALAGSPYRLTLRGPGGVQVVLPAELRDRVKPSGRPPIIFAEFVFQAQSADEAGSPPVRQVNGVVRSIVFRDLLTPSTVLHTLEVSPIEAPRLPTTAAATTPTPTPVAVAPNSASTPAPADAPVPPPAPVAAAPQEVTIAPAAPVTIAPTPGVTPAPAPQVDRTVPVPAAPQAVTIMPNAPVTIAPGPGVAPAPSPAPEVQAAPTAPAPPIGVTVAPVPGITIIGPAGAPIPATPTPAPSPAAPAPVGGANVASLPPASEIRVDPAAGTMFVQSTATLRAAPNTNGARLAALSQGQQLELTGRVEGGGWVRVRHQGREGFVAANLLSTTPPVQVAAVVPRAVEGRATVVDTATLRVEGQNLRLFGVQGLAGESAQSFQRFIDSQGGSVRCDPQSGGAFVCRTSAGVDIAAAALVNGAACPTAGASEIYRQQSEQARVNRRGLWATGRCA